MAGRMSRRTFLTLVPASGLVSGPAGAFPLQNAQSVGGGGPAAPTLHGLYPTQDPELVREMVGVSHFDLARVRTLLETRPTLANATWDWGFGDWESSLGAASHVGNRDIAELLLAKGARATIFSAAMLGHLDVVKAFVAASPGVQRTRGPHGISLLAHARAGGAAAAEVLRYLESLGDADPRYTSVPLTDGETLVGTYVFGPGPNDRFEIADNKGTLTVKRPGGSAQRLTHVGSRSFHPPGAETVRIRFGGDVPRPTTLTVEDADLVLTARRLAE